MYKFSRVKNRRVIGLKNKGGFFFQASRLLSCHYDLAFKLFSLLVQRFGNVCSKYWDSSLMRSMLLLF